MPEANIPLTPLQTALILQALADPGAAQGSHVHQLRLRLATAASEAECIDAWQRTVRRLPVLSSRFEYGPDSRPVRIESGLAPPDATRVAPMAATRQEYEACVRRVLAEDRERGVESRSPPLARLTLIRGPQCLLEGVITCHDALLDAGSVARVGATFLRELGARTPAPRGASDAPSTLCPPAVGNQGKAAEALEHFVAVYGDREAPTPLPLAPLPTHEGRGLFGEVELALDDLEPGRLADRTALDWEALVAAAWAIVLARCTRESEVVFGAFVPLEQGEADRCGELGVSHNIVPVVTAVEEDLTARQLLARQAAQLEQARRHSQVELSELARRSGLAAGTDLFETCVRLEHVDIEATLSKAVADAGLDVASFEAQLFERPPVPLLVSLRLPARRQALSHAPVADEASPQTVDDRATLRICFELSRLRREHAANLGRYLFVALRGLVSDPERRVRDISVLPERDRERILHAWNDTRAPFSRDSLVPEVFESQVKDQPRHAALEGPRGVALDYECLDALADRLASRLGEMGMTSAERIGVCAHRGAELLVAILGIAKSGATYVPLDPRYAPDVLVDCCVRGGIRLVITEPSMRKVFQVRTLSTEALLAEAPQHHEKTPTPRAARPSASHPFYVIFTSGSTGSPKGVVVSHRAVMNTLEWVNGTFGVGPADRILYVNSPCFDLSVYDLFGVLAAGGTVVVPSEAELADPGILARKLTSARISIWNSTPAALARILPFLPTGEPNRALRLILLSGDFMPLSLPPLLRRHFPSARLINLGGATEAAIWSNYFEVERVEEHWTSIPYGRPIQNARYYALDHRLEPVPVGAPGELYIGGACVADGYVDRPDLTAERFIPDPFVPDEGTRLYRTGDLARYHEDGNLELLGRSDFQVKIRGFRVELPAVEAVIATLAEVRQVICSAAQDPSGEKSLIAYLVTAPGANLDAQRVKEHVENKLPPYMVPSHVLFLDAVPLGPTGKPDRKRLPLPPRRAASAPGATESSLEAWLSQQYRYLLGVPEVSLDDDFFSLGGHSLLAVLLISRLYQSFGAQVSLPAFLAKPTVRALGEVARRAIGGVAASPHIQSFHPTAGRPPLLLVPGMIGTAFTFRFLPELLGPAQPVHVLDLLQLPPEAATVERIAELALDEWKQAPIDRPIVVGGFSFGAVVAFELARRLVQRGHRVPLLVSFDGCAPGYPRSRKGLEGLLMRAAEFVGNEPQRRKAELLQRARGVMGRAVRPLRRPKEAPPRHELQSKMAEAEERQRRARRSYAPDAAIPSALLLFRCQNLSDGPAAGDTLLGWSNYVHGPVSLVTIQEKHLELFADRHMPQIAEALRDHLQRYVGEPSHSSLPEPGMTPTK